jgi:hemerythrin-like domain-containing protein
MTTITAALSADHRCADQLFEAARQAAEGAEWSTSKRFYGEFLQALKRHMAIEEDVLFPAFEQATGVDAGPTVVMRDEHRQLLAMLDRIGAAIAACDVQSLRRSAQAFAQVMAAHSAKEEKVLYPMCDRVLAASGDETLSRILSELEPLR